MDSQRILNPEQEKAVRHGRGPLLIIAGAGTGKTTVITERIRHLISAGIAKPGEILALTFTEKASREMEERVDRIMPYGFADLWISTFHSFCDRIIRAEGIHIGIDPAYTVMTQAESVSLMRRHIHSLNLDYFRPLGNPHKFISAMLAHFDRLRDEDITPASYLAWVKKLPGGKTEEEKLEKKKSGELSSAYRQYEEIKIRENVFDYADLIASVLKLFRTRPNILARYRDQFKYILVDEFQDTNFSQNELAVLLAVPGNNLTVVGDDDQAIYRFRGAAISNILDFRKRFPGAESVVLTGNYRSTREILDRSYDLIVHNNPDRLEVAEKISKKLESRRLIGGRPVEFLYAPRVEDEAALVAKKIRELMEEKAVDRYQAVTILVRANDHAEPFTRALSRAGIPYQFLGPGQLFRQKEVKDLIAYLSFLSDINDSAALYRVLNLEVISVNPRDLAAIMSFIREYGLTLFEGLERCFSEEKEAADQNLPKPKVGDGTRVILRKFLEMVSRHLALIKKDTAGQILYYFLEDTGLLSRMASYRSDAEEKEAVNIARFFAKIKSYEAGHDDASVYAVVDWIHLSMELGESPLAGDTDWTENNAVNIMTVHSAKGLEFPVVFVVNCVAERFPTRDRKELLPIPEDLIKETLPVGDAHLQEERRLFYVAMTRARDRLYLTAAGFYGEGKREKKISRFVAEALGEAAASVKPVILPEFSQLGLWEWQAPPAPVGATPSGNPGPLTVSYSRLETFGNCPLQYRYRYLLAIPVPASAALTFGDTIHRTLHRFYERIRAGETVSLPDLLALYGSLWNPKGYAGRAYETRMRERGVKILTGYFEKGMKGPGQPVDLEKPFRIKITGSVIVTGKIDRVDRLPDGRLEIIDYKTGQSPKTKDPAKDRQLTMYALAACDRSVYNLKPENVTVSLYFLEDQTKVSATRTEKDLADFAGSVQTTVAGIRKGAFPPTPGRHCDFCEFRLVCDAWK